MVGTSSEPANGGFDPSSVVAETLSSVNGGAVKREIVLGRNVHTTCLAVTEPEANDELTGDMDAHMASVLARYRKNLLDRTKHHLGIHSNFLLYQSIYVCALIQLIKNL